MRMCCCVRGGVGGFVVSCLCFTAVQFDCGRVWKESVGLSVFFVGVNDK